MNDEKAGPVYPAQPYGVTGAVSMILNAIIEAVSWCKCTYFVVTFLFATAFVSSQNVILCN